MICRVENYEDERNRRMMAFMPVDGTPPTRFQGVAKATITVLKDHPPVEFHFPFPIAGSSVVEAYEKFDAAAEIEGHKPEVRRRAYEQFLAEAPPQLRAEVEKRNGSGILDATGSPIVKRRQ